LKHYDIYELAFDNFNRYWKNKAALTLMKGSVIRRDLPPQNLTEDYFSASMLKMKTRLKPT